MQRLFIAASIKDDHARREMDYAWKRITEILPEHAKASRQDQPHITLRFLGDVNTDDARQAHLVALLQDDVRRIAKSTPPVDLTLGYLHTFPGNVWLSVGCTQEDTDSLRTLQRRISAATERAAHQGLHLPPTTRYDFTPHITLGAFTPDHTDQLQEALRDSQYPQQAPFRINALEFLENIRQPDGSSRYHPAASPARLTGDPP